MAITQYSDISTLIPDIWEGAMMVARDNNIMAPLVRNFTGQGMQPRKNSLYGTVNFSSVGEADDIVAQTYTRAIKSTLTPGEVAASFFLTDQRVESDDQDIVGDAARELGIGLAQKIETDIVSLFASVTGGSVGAGGTPTWGHVLAAQSILRNANAPGPYTLVIHPYVYHQLAKVATVAISTQTNAPALQDRLVQNFYMGSAYGVDIFTTSNIPVASNLARGVLFSRDAFALDTRRPPRLERERDAGRRGWELVMSAVYAYGTWRPEWGVQLYTDATTPSS